MDFNPLDYLPTADDIGGLITDPTLLTGLGAQALGTYLTAQRYRKIQNNQQALIDAQRAKQQALQQEANAKIAAATTKASAPQQEADREALAQQYLQKFTPQITDDAEFNNLNQGAPAVVKTKIGEAMADAARKGAAHAKATADLSSYTGQGLNTSIMLNRLGQDVGRVAASSNSNAAILPYQLQAQLRGERSRGVTADIANGLGDLLVKSALTRPDPNRKTRIPKLPGTTPTLD